MYWICSEKGWICSGKEQIQAVHELSSVTYTSEQLPQDVCDYKQICPDYLVSGCIAICQPPNTFFNLPQKKRKKKKKKKRGPFQLTHKCSAVQWRNRSKCRHFHLLTEDSSTHWQHERPSSSWSWNARFVAPAMVITLWWARCGRWMYIHDTYALEDQSLNCDHGIKWHDTWTKVSPAQLLCFPCKQLNMYVTKTLQQTQANPPFPHILHSIDRIRSLTDWQSYRDLFLITYAPYQYSGHFILAHDWLTQQQDPILPTNPKHR